MPDIGRRFIDRSRAFLTSDYVPRIRKSVEELDEADVWWRPNPQSNSIGNLLLHLSGNVRQWVVSGIGGEVDVRRRDQEFAADGKLTRRELLDLLDDTVQAADRVLAQLPVERLLEQRTIQGHQVTVLEAIYHVVEHFGMHTGQIIYITKLRTSRDLKFYDVDAGIATRRW